MTFQFFNPSARPALFPVRVFGVPSFSARDMCSGLESATLFFRLAGR